MYSWAPKIMVYIFRQKDSYCIFKICCTIFVLFPTECPLFHNFIFIGPCNIRVLHKGCTKIYISTPRLLKVKSDTGRSVGRVCFLLLCVHYQHTVLYKVLMLWGLMPPLFTEVAVLQSGSCAGHMSA
jgi:hypothetical protein